MNKTQELANDVYDKLLGNAPFAPEEYLTPFDDVENDVHHCYVQNNEDGTSTIRLQTNKGAIEMTIREWQ